MELSKIVIYPIKSLDGVSVESTSITEGGSLQFDRCYAMLDSDGKFINAKRFPEIHLIKTTYSPDFTQVSLGLRSLTDSSTFSLSEPNLIAKWLSDYFGFPVRVVTNPANGFPDDSKAYGPTLTCDSSLQTVASWFPGLSEENVRRRFRSNLEVNAPQPFWEDRLFGEAGSEVKFRIGDVLLMGQNPCQRCAVPTRDQDDGKSMHNFSAEFSTQRKAMLPEWAILSRFNHFYRFAVNTTIPLSQAGKRLHLGDTITLDDYGY